MYYQGTLPTQALCQRWCFPPLILLVLTAADLDLPTYCCCTQRGSNAVLPHPKEFSSNFPPDLATGSKSCFALCFTKLNLTVLWCMLRRLRRDSVPVRDICNLVLELWAGRHNQAELNQLHRATESAAPDQQACLVASCPARPLMLVCSRICVWLAGG